MKKKFQHKFHEDFYKKITKIFNLSKYQNPSIVKKKNYSYLQKFLHYEIYKILRKILQMKFSKKYVS